MRVQASQLNPSVLEELKELFFRQSFINDYILCPQMALYKWVFGFDETPPFMAAVLGTAGHAVIEAMHRTSSSDPAYFKYSWDGIARAFENAFFREYEKLAVKPTVKGTIHEAYAEKAAEYIELLQGYQSHPRNREFHITLAEQPFVLTVHPESEDGQKLAPEDRKPYYFTGTIDQGGVYDDGRFAIRDTKFKDNSFRPSQAELDRNIQLTIYAAAMRFGQPACETCKPKYVIGDFGIGRELVYNGPCPPCKRKIGTQLWPQRYPDICEMIWMRDFERRTKDEYPEYITDRENKRLNPQTQRLVFAEKKNPQWFHGAKKGDYKGPCFLKTYRQPSRIDVLMRDVLMLARGIRRGVFYRNPGSHCSFWCAHERQCANAIETSMSEVAILDEVNAFESR